MRTRPVRLFHLMAVRAFRQSRGKEMIVRAPDARAPLGMSPFWIRHNLLLVLAPFAATHNAFPIEVGFYGHFARKSIVS
jgi:hypothetical protein